MKDGHLTVYDFSIPLESFNDMVEETRGHLGPLAKRVTGFGHLGISNKACKSNKNVVRLNL